MVAQDRQLHRDTQLLHFKNYIYRVCDLDSLTHRLNIISLTTPIDPEDELWYYRHMAHRIDPSDTYSTLTLQVHWSHSIRPAAIPLLSACSPFSLHNLRKQGEDKATLETITMTEYENENGEHSDDDDSIARVRSMQPIHDMVY